MFTRLASATRVLRESPHQLALRLKAAALYLALRQAYLVATLLQPLVNTSQQGRSDVDQALLRPISPVFAFSRPTTPILERPTSRAGLSRPSTPVLQRGLGLPRAFDSDTDDEDADDDSDIAKLEGGNLGASSGDNVSGSVYNYFKSSLERWWLRTASQPSPAATLAWLLL
jgi:hypothetical protein